MELIKLLIGSGGLLGVFYLIFKIGKVAQTIDAMAIDMKQINSKVEKIDSRINFLEIQVGKLETRVEERTLRVVHTGNEDKIKSS